MAVQGFLLQSVGEGRCMNFGTCGSWAWCLRRPWIFLHQRPSPCPQHWQAGFLSTESPGSPRLYFRNTTSDGYFGRFHLASASGLQFRTFCEPTQRTSATVAPHRLVQPFRVLSSVDWPIHKLHSGAVPPAVSALSLLEL